MMNMTISDQIQKLSSEMYMEMNKLCSNVSDIGDWKINKIYEYRLLGKEDPYNFEELCAARQECRDKINALQEQIKALEAEAMAAPAEEA